MALLEPRIFHLLLAAHMEALLPSLGPGGIQVLRRRAARIMPAPRLIMEAGVATLNIPSIQCINETGVFNSVRYSWSQSYSKPHNISTNGGQKQNG